MPCLAAAQVARQNHLVHNIILPACRILKSVSVQHRMLLSAVAEASVIRVLPMRSMHAGLAEAQVQLLSAIQGKRRCCLLGAFLRVASVASVTGRRRSFAKQSFCLCKQHHSTEPLKSTADQDRNPTASSPPSASTGLTLSAVTAAARESNVCRLSKPTVLSLVEQAQTCLVQPFRTGCSEVRNGVTFAT